MPVQSHLETHQVGGGMKRAGWLIGISCAVAVVSAGSKAFSQPANAQHPASQWSTIENYCFGCHNEGVRAGNLFLEIGRAHV